MSDYFVLEFGSVRVSVTLDSGLVLVSITTKLSELPPWLQRVFEQLQQAKSAG